MTTKPRLCTALLTLAIAVSASAPVLAQSMAGGSAKNRYANQTKLDPYPPEGGWQGLANLLEAAKPGVDTRLDPTPSQITDRIEELLNRGANEEALSLIERREAAIKGQRGADVQLMFQHARALAALGRADEAIAVYSDMTTQFPELPEPWTTWRPSMPRAVNSNAPRTVYRWPCARIPTTPPRAPTSATSS